MNDYEIMLEDRLTKIKAVIEKYGEDNFYLSFSGGKDSTVLSALVDIACPGNKIPRVYANTGIDFNMVRDFVFELKETDNRIIDIKPSIPIKLMLEGDGYPFKSKSHSRYVKRFQDKGLEYKSVRAYLQLEKTLSGKDIYRPCPKILKYQFTEENKLKISDMCCIRLKEEPLSKWQKENNKIYGINGIMRDEGGRREHGTCLSFGSDKKLRFFQPLIPVTKEWEDWLIDKYNIKICDIYKEPYNLPRTGCKGCPFAMKLQEELDTLEKFFPDERKQCEIIWKPVYDEYRRLGYRLKKNDPQMAESEGKE